MHRVWPTASDKLELCMRTKDSISKTLILFAFCTDMNTLHTLTSLLVWVHSFLFQYMNDFYRPQSWFGFLHLHPVLTPNHIPEEPEPPACPLWGDGLRADPRFTPTSAVTSSVTPTSPLTTSHTCPALPRSSATPELNGAVSELLHQQSTVLFLGMKQHCCPCPSCASTALSRDVCLIATGGGVAALTSPPTKAPPSSARHSQPVRRHAVAEQRADCCFAELYDRV